MPAYPSQAARRAGLAAAAVLVAGAAAAQPAAVDPRLADAIAWYTGVAGTVDDPRANALLLQAAADGDPISRMWLARCHSTGRMGFPRDPERARAIARDVLPAVREAADAGVPEAVFLMGTAHAEGLGVPEDAAAAVPFYRRAAEAGHVLAQHNMGNAYADGRGVPQSDVQAVYWWELAAKQGDAIPQFRLGQAYEAGLGVAPDLARAKHWYGEAARRGLARAREALARLGG